MSDPIKRLIGRTVTPKRTGVLLIVVLATLIVASGVGAAAGPETGILTACDRASHVAQAFFIEEACELAT